MIGDAAEREADSRQVMSGPILRNVLAALYYFKKYLNPFMHLNLARTKVHIVSSKL